jgi:hypothetical protein
MIQDGIKAPVNEMVRLLVIAQSIGDRATWFLWWGVSLP